MEIYVVRHGKTESGKNKIIADIKEPLNTNGIQQAKNIGKELCELNIDVVYYSPIERAEHTLKLFNLNDKIPTIVDERLKERNMGIYENVKFDALDWEKFWGYDSEQSYSELESMKSVYKRVSNFLEELKLKEKNKKVLLVTHGGVARAIYWYFNGVDKSLFKCENCKIYKYII